MGETRCYMSVMSSPPSQIGIQFVGSPSSKLQVWWEVWNMRFLFSLQNRCPIFMQIEIFFLFSCHSSSSFSFLLSSLFLLFLIDIVMTYTRVTLTKKARFACSGNICNVLSTSIHVQKGKSCIKVKSRRLLDRKRERERERWKCHTIYMDSSFQV